MRIVKPFAAVATAVLLGLVAAGPSQAVPNVSGPAVPVSVTLDASQDDSGWQ